MTTNSQALRRWCLARAKTRDQAGRFAGTFAEAAGDPPDDLGDALDYARSVHGEPAEAAFLVTQLNGGRGTRPAEGTLMWRGGRPL